MKTIDQLYETLAQKTKSIIGHDVIVHYNDIGGRCPSVYVYSDELGMDSLPPKVGVYRNYNGGGMCSGIHFSEIHNASKDKQGLLLQIQELFEWFLLEAERLLLGDETERGATTNNNCYCIIG